MGGRIASQVVAQGVDATALALFAYPLHPPGKPSQWRDEHLLEINIPTLFCSGTRDTFATPDELETVAARISDATVHILDGADHGFSVLTSSNRTRDESQAKSLSPFIGLVWLVEKEPVPISVNPMIPLSASGFVVKKF